MDEKATSAIILSIVILSGIIGMFFIYNETYGKSVAGTKGFLEATHHTELAEKALELEINTDEEIEKIYDFLSEGKRVCVTLINTRTRAIQQEFIRQANQIENIEDMVEVRSLKLGPTYKLVNVAEAPCKPLEQILNIKEPKLA